MAGLKALFGAAQVKNILERFQEESDKKILRIYQYLGEEFVDKARLAGNYKDRTGNLRSSIGYIILKDGRIVASNFEGNSAGTSQGRKVAAEVAANHPDGWVLIGVSGMDYAAYVEAKNFDVITGSAPGSAEIKAMLREINP